VSPPGDRLTEDTLFDGRLVCRQFSNGYRFSIDAVLAAHFCTIRDDWHILDLGCGCGIIGMIIAYRHPGLQVTGLELQPELAELARQNINANAMEKRVSVVQGNLRSIGEHVAPEHFDLVVSNPPYREPGTGRTSPENQRARARHEIAANLDDVVKAAAFAVKNRGRVVFVYPAKRAATLINRLVERNLEPKRLQPVYSYPESENASLVLVEAVKNGGEEISILPPLYIFTEKNGPYTDQVQELYS